MPRPTISACIAVYNGADHLSGAIDSVINQTVKPDEILVLDDGSTDGSVQVAQSFDKVRVIQQPNGGIGAARKRLVEEAQFDWIAFCDHDDWWNLNRIEKELPLTADPAVTLIYSGVEHVDENGVRTDSTLHAGPETASIDHLVPHPEDIWTSSTLLRRSAVLEAGNFNPNYRTGEDMLMWFQLGSLGKIVQVPDRLVNMLRRSNSTSSGNRRQYEYAVSLYEKEVLPNLDRWFPDLLPEKRADCRRLLEAKVGYTMSILAAYLDLEGDHRSAIAMYRKATKWAPRSKGAWYRYLRSLLRIPAQPPA